MSSEIPLEAVGSPVQEAGARLVRPRFRTEPLAVKVWGAHVEGRNRELVSFAVADRAQLQSLITDLVLAQQAWAKA
jgi:hypothetical protein